MEYKDKVKQIFSYLLNVKNSNEKPIRNILDYEKLYWESDICRMTGCSVNKNSNREWWLEVGKKSKGLYDELFKLYMELERKEENIEIIWGHGLITWRYNGEKIMYPLIVTSMKLCFDDNNSTLKLVPIGNTVMETNIFEGIDVPNLFNIFEVSEKINKSNIDPRNMDNIKEFLEEIVAYLSPKSKLDKENNSKEKINILDYPIIYNAPIIFIRKISMKLWQLEIRNIISEIDNGYPIPATIKALVDDKKIEQEEKDLKEWEGVANNLLFPLPANSEQKEVVKRICENYGVVVQGPPGTGKSHTIANLICHLLAHGKRVLVTSQTDRALKVLSEKIPESIKPLCMSVLGNDANSLKQLNESVRKMTDNLAENPQNLYSEIQSLESELNLCRKSQSNLYNKLEQMQKLENNNINYNGSNYKIIDIAKWVKENKDQYSWIEDKIDVKQDMPLKEEEFDRLIHLLDTISKEDKRFYDKTRFVIDKLPTDEEICDKVSRLKELNEKYKYTMNLLQGWRIPDDRCDYDKFLETLKQYKNEVREIKQGIFKNILEDFRNSKIIRQSFNDLSHKCNEYLLMLSKIRNELRSHSIIVPEGVKFDEFSEDFDTLYEHISLKGRIGRVFKVIHPQCNYIINECRVDHRPIVNLDQALILKLHIQERLILRDLKSLWNNVREEYGTKVEVSNSENLELIVMEQYINNLNSIINWEKKCKNEINEICGKIIIPEGIDWYREETYDYLIECIECIKSLDEYNKLKAYIQVLKKVILTTGKLGELYNALEELNIIKIKEAIKDIENFKSVKGKFLELDRLIEKGRTACPITLNKIINNWGQNLSIFKNWNNAWKWTQWKNILESIYNPNIEYIEEAIEEEETKEKLLIEEIVAKKTWYNQILRITEGKKRSLFAWMQAVKRIGKGTGKMVSEYRKIAQSEMKNCKDVIPVWIMPVDRIIENIKLTRNLFDVVIIDESSQSNIFSICALMRAKKAVIVGDDKQISPENVGVDQSTIHGLINKYLKDIPQSEWFDLQTSLYDTALRVFPNRLMLKEHFRCVPEIIGFSNKYCYNGRIRPLRYANSFEAIYPPIVEIKVEDGCREQNKPININEAECLVNKIVECCKDRIYLGMTMGVISLLGESQSELIESMLRDKIGEEEMVKRRLICGDAYSFQGDERDIMFLSMVISSDAKFTALTKKSDIRRFNVAASRARNQLFLFHSVDLEELNPECVRYWLLHYCINYTKFNNTNKNVDYAFQSRFQKDIYNLVRVKGYTLMPNIKVGTYKIDFIIEGSRGRAAIICDGDITTGIYKWRENIEKQLDLERLGWTFCRIRAGEFYYDTEGTLKRLFEKLKKIGIEQYNSNLLDENLKVV